MSGLKRRSLIVLSLVVVAGLFSHGMSSNIIHENLDIPIESIESSERVVMPTLPELLCGIDECMMAPTKVLSQRRQENRESYPHPRETGDIKTITSGLSGADLLGWQLTGKRILSDMELSCSDMVMMGNIRFGAEIIRHQRNRPSV